MRWSRDFTSLVLRFANRVAAVGGLCPDDALLGWTPLYLNFGLDRSFDPQHPVWQEFLGGYREAHDPVAWTHAFYLTHVEDDEIPAYGCFSSRHETQTRTIRFHFYAERDDTGPSPISRERASVRREELTAMFAAIRRDVPQAEMVRGRSWLYNVPAYCRLFPPAYVQTAVAIEPELQFLSLWGQFLDRRWELRSGAATAFAAAFEGASSLDELARSFPLGVLAPRCRIEPFYAFYGIEPLEDDR